MHVLVIPSWYSSAFDTLSGSFFYEQIQALKGVGIKIGVIYPEFVSMRKLSFKTLRLYHFNSIAKKENDIPTYRMFLWRIPGSPKIQCIQWNWALKILYKKYCKKFGIPDFIHAQGMMWAGYAASNISLKFNIPFIVTEHNGVFFGREQNKKIQLQNWHKPLLNQIKNRTAGFYAVSNSLKEALRKYFEDPNMEISIIPNMVDTELFFPPKTPPSREPFKFLVVGMFVYEKAFDILINAFKKLYEQNKDIHLDIIGYGVMENELRNLVNQLKLEQNISFLGRVSREQVAQKMRETNCFILSSRWETFGVVLIEAFSSGLPVIATMCGGPNDIMTESFLGIPIKPEDEKMLLDAMLKMIETYDSYSSSKIREYIMDKYSHKAFARYQKLKYEEIMNKIKEMKDRIK